MFTPTVKAISLEANPNTISITLPLPPSVNNIYVNSERGRYSTREFNEWVRDAGYFLTQHKGKIAREASYKIFIFLPGNMRGDIDNRVKPLLDVLVKYHVTPDDKHNDMLFVCRDKYVPANECVVFINADSSIKIAKIGKKQESYLTMLELTDIVCAFYNISAKDLISRQRDNVIVYYRKIAAFCLAHYYPWAPKYLAISRTLQRERRSMVIYSNTIRRQILNGNEKLQREIETIFKIAGGALDIEKLKAFVPPVCNREIAE